ncbi:hypothetical protein [Pacificibacter marinus]|uniref:hypothetical protein n=1 Tax=Pacificibacter marinus TaxID=658057 RepID=UPI001C07508D|nr:hypothetical protein [Pacificibacter marinus]MBU2867040.1 hypothetical protein [Pacificibacter marinus]
MPATELKETTTITVKHKSETPLMIHETVGDGEYGPDKIPFQVCRSATNLRMEVRMGDLVAQVPITDMIECCAAALHHALQSMGEQTH